MLRKSTIFLYFEVTFLPIGFHYLKMINMIAIFGYSWASDLVEQELIVLIHIKNQLLYCILFEKA